MIACMFILCMGRWLTLYFTCQIRIIVLDSDLQLLHTLWMPWMTACASVLELIVSSVLCTSQMKSSLLVPESKCHENEQYSLTHSWKGVPVDGM